MLGKHKLNKIVCPYCGYKMPLIFSNESNSIGVFITCKGRDCHKDFEVNIKNGIQIKE